MPRFGGFLTTKTKGRSAKGLTPTQLIILQAAAKSPTGSVRFLAGDRQGTRVVGYTDMGIPKIVAYCTPEHFLEGRGLIEKGNEPHSYRITDKGRAALPAAEIAP